jgi:hypothetical protein
MYVLISVQELMKGIETSQPDLPIIRNIVGARQESRKEGKPCLDWNMDFVSDNRSP